MKRVLKWVARVFGVLLLLIVAGVALLHTGCGKSFVRKRIEAKLSDACNGKVSLGKLDYTFLFGSVELGDLDIEDASGKRAIHVGTLHVDLDRGSVIHDEPVIEALVVDGLALDVDQHADGTTNLTGLFKPSDSKPLEHVTINQLVVDGRATITKPDGTKVEIANLAIAGHLDAHPAAQSADVVIDKIAASATITAPEQPVRKAELAVGGITLAKKGDTIDATIAAVTAGPLQLDNVTAHANLVDGKPKGAQSITIDKGHVGRDELARFLGHNVLIGDVDFDAKLDGVAEALVIHGGVRTGGTTLTLDGVVDASNPHHPAYDLKLEGKGKSADVVAGAMPVETDIKIAVKGAGIEPQDLVAELTVDVGPTTVRGIPSAGTTLGPITLDGVHAHALADRGAFKLDDLTAKGLAFEVHATADVAKDRTLTAHVALTGNPQEAVRVLGAAGFAIPRKVPVLKKLDIAITATGKADGDLAVTVEPTKLGIAGGEIAFGGSAHLDMRPEAKAANKVLVDAASTIDLRNLDLVSLAALAGKPAKAKGTLSGHLELARTATSQHATTRFSIALRDPDLDVGLTADATATDADVTATVSKAGVKLTTTKAHVSLDANGLRFDGPWHIVLDAPTHDLVGLVALLPPEVQDKVHAKLPNGVPAGNVALHADIAGTPRRPSGTIDITAQADALPALGTQKITSHVTLAPNANGIGVVDKTTIAIDKGPPIVVDANASLPPLQLPGPTPLDVNAVTYDAHVTIPERALADFAPIRDKLAQVGGTVDGQVTVGGSVAKPSIAATLSWHGYGTADGKQGETKLTATGDPTHVVVVVTHGPIAITADVAKQGEHVEIHAKGHADDSPILPLVPAFVLPPGKLPSELEPGRIKMDFDGNVVLDHGEVVERHVTGGIDVSGASFTLPHTTRKWDQIGLSITAKDESIHLASLSLHEADIEDKDRRILITGDASRERASLTLTAHDWLLSGGTLFGDHDAPRASVDFDIGVDADLTKPIPLIDATVRKLDLRSPDRQERAHQPEKISVSGDVIFLDDKTVVGKLPFVPAEEPEQPKKRPHLDIRVHIPGPVHLVQTPFDLTAHGELTVTVRDEGVSTRGALDMTKGQLWLFGRYHDLVDGKVSFTDEHPHGWMELTFERRIPDVAMRELAPSAGNGRITFVGPPTKPKTTLSGASSGGLMETMSMLNAGRPLNVTAPDLPATETVQVPRGDQLFVLTFMATNLPHLLFLDRIAAWADPYAPKGGYGQIHDVDAERDLSNGNVRVRAVVRPPVPGRSEGELQLDRVFVHGSHTEMGVGVRAGDRVGGGLGLFLEWTSD